MCYWSHHHVHTSCNFHWQIVDPTLQTLIRAERPVGVFHYIPARRLLLEERDCGLWTSTKGEVCFLDSAFDLPLRPSRESARRRASNSLALRIVRGYTLGCTTSNLGALSLSPIRNSELHLEPPWWKSLTNNPNWLLKPAKPNLPISEVVSGLEHPTKWVWSRNDIAAKHPQFSKIVFLKNNTLDLQNWIIDNFMGVGSSEVSFTQAASLELQSLKTFSAKKLLWTWWGCKCLKIVTQ
jgi:hypothetical protein